MKLRAIRLIGLLVIILGMCVGIGGCKFTTDLIILEAVFVPPNQVRYVFRITFRYCGKKLFSTKGRGATTIPSVFPNSRLESGGGATDFDVSIDRNGTDIPVVEDPVSTQLLESTQPFAEVPPNQTWRAFEMSMPGDFELSDDPYTLEMQVLTDDSVQLPANYTFYSVVTFDESFSSVFLTRHDCSTLSESCEQTVLRDDLSINIPAASAWSLAVMGLAFATGGTLIARRMRVSGGKGELFTASRSSTVSEMA